MDQAEFPQMVSGFFGILMSKPPYKVWDLEHFPMLQKSTLNSQQLSCSAAVSSGSAMGSMMQHIENELQYRCSSDSGSVMGSSTEGNSAVDEGQQPEINNAEGALKQGNMQQAYC